MIYESIRLFQLNEVFFTFTALGTLCDKLNKFTKTLRTGQKHCFSYNQRN